MEHRGLVAPRSSAPRRWACCSSLGYYWNDGLHPGPHRRCKRAVSCKQRIPPIRTDGRRRNFGLVLSRWVGRTFPVRGLGSPLVLCRTGGGRSGHSRCEKLAARRQHLGWSPSPSRTIPRARKEWAGLRRRWRPMPLRSRGSEDKKVAVTGSQDKKAAVRKGIDSRQERSQENAEALCLCQLCQAATAARHHQDEKSGIQPIEGSSASSLPYQKSDSSSLLKPRQGLGAKS